MGGVKEEQVEQDQRNRKEGREEAGRQLGARGVVPRA